jgi:hypothetical protein
MIDVGVPALETELNESDAFSAVSSVEQTLDGLNPARINRPKRDWCENGNYRADCRGIELSIPSGRENAKRAGPQAPRLHDG